MDPRAEEEIRHDLRNALMIAMGNARIIVNMLAEQGATPDPALISERANKAHSSMMQIEGFINEWAEGSRRRRKLEAKTGT